MPGLATLEASFVAANCAQFLTLAAAARSLDDRLTIGCRTPLETLVLANNYVLVDCLIDFELLRGDERLHIVGLVARRTAVLHALDGDSFSSRNCQSDMLFYTLKAEQMFA